MTLKVHAPASIFTDSWGTDSSNECQASYVIQCSYLSHLECVSKIIWQVGLRYYEDNPSSNKSTHCLDTQKEKYRESELLRIASETNLINAYLICQLPGKVSTVIFIGKVEDEYISTVGLY